MISALVNAITCIIKWIYVGIFILCLVIGVAGVLAHKTLLKADEMLHRNDVDMSRVNIVKYLGY